MGNTTVRSPFRLREGLVVLSTSPLQGNLRGQEQEIAFRNLLGEHGIVKLGEDPTNSAGRKWRAALNQLGFLYPKIPSALGIPQHEVGPIDMITPNGWRLIRAETVSAMQECFLRALAAYCIPSPVEQGYNFNVFSPLRHILKIMLALENKVGTSQLNFIEMALVVQLTSGDDDITEVVERIVELQARREAADNKRIFDRQALEVAAKLHKYEAQTFNDYADTNIRYLKATGLVQGKGRGLTLVPEKRVFIEKLVEYADGPDSDRSYLSMLCNGATLPTDNKDSALAVLEDIIGQLNRWGVPLDIHDRKLDDAGDIAIVRHEIEDLLSKLKEEDFALRQPQQWEEIAAYMELIISRRGSITLPDGDKIEILQAEAPAYLEWVLWRAFLAIDRLINKPYQARRFKIDQDFLPVGTAPGNGPDLIFEFEDFVLVVEATLTDNSRQEAAEGEPVRRHVARIVETYPGKRVFGLFIANRVDTNTAETFRIGFWYRPDDSKMSLQIVPLTLEQFEKLFRAGFSSGRISPKVMQEFLRDCLAVSNHDAPEWKRLIGEEVIRYSSQMSG